MKAVITLKSRRPHDATSNPQLIVNKNRKALLDKALRFYCNHLNWCYLISSYEDIKIQRNLGLWGLKFCN